MAQLVNFAWEKATACMNVDLTETRYGIETDFEVSFEQLFKAHFKSLHRYAYAIVDDQATAEEMVQNVFCRLWEKRNLLDISHSPKAYLYRSVYHESLNYLKHQKVRAAHQAHVLRHESEAVQGDSMVHQELTRKLKEALNELPEQCRTIFQMSRFEDLKYREIAEQLGLSVKTIENQMGKALRLLRGKLADFLVTFLYFFLTL